MYVGFSKYGGALVKFRSGTASIHMATGRYESLPVSGRCVSAAMIFNIYMFTNVKLNNVDMKIVKEVFVTLYI
jgi:hypothetical protein